MGGVLMSLAGSGSGGTPTNHNVFVGVNTVKNFSSWGYSGGNLLYTFGGLDVTSKSTFIIDGIYDNTDTGTYTNTILKILGDHSSNNLVTTMTVDGTNVNLGAPAYSYTVTSAVTMTIASPCVITWTSRTFGVGTPVIFTTTGALPSGLLAGQPYFVVSVATNTFTVSATKGGAAINTTGTQSGTHSAFTNPSTNWTGTTQTFPVTGSVSASTVSVGTPSLVTCSAAHGFVNGDKIGFTTGTLPTGLSLRTVYYVINAASTTFNVSLTSGGAAINTTGTSTGPFTVLKSRLVTLS